MDHFNDFVFKSRAKSVFIVFLVLFMVCALRLVQVQVIQSDSYSEQALKFRTDIYNIQAKRGSIVDYNGRILANSVERYNIGVNQKVIAEYKHYEKIKNPVTGAEELKLVGKGPEEAAKQLSKILEVDEAQLGGKMIGDSSFTYLVKDVSPQTWRKIKALGIYGIEPEKVSKREYPNKNTAGNIIGFVGSENKGLAGLELTQNKLLTGKAGKGMVEIGPTGEVIPDGLEKVVEDVPGKNIRTTVRIDLQHQAEEAINEAVKSTGAEWGSAIVMEVGTGSVLAMADSNAVDPEHPGRTPAKDRGSRIVQDAYEPGSTMKLVTASGVIEEKKATPLNTVSVPDNFTVRNGQKFKDAFPHPSWTLTLAGVIAYSSNVGTIQFGDYLQDEYRYKLLRQFGFGSATGIELPGETSGILTPSNKWDGRQRYTTMFGQGLATTTLQVASMVETIANNGVRSPVHLIDGYERHDGKYEKAKLKEPVKVLSKDTAEQMRKVMATVFDGKHNGLEKAKVSGYRLGGKTGTAEIYNSAGQNTGYISSLVAAVPIENPKVIVSVVLYKPNSTWSGNTTAPPFTKIVKAAVREMKIPPSTTPPDVYPLRPGE
ncbi:penicillin-binding protein 2 [Actinomyces sp. zg-332]|uniref:peptidoglycan D,D-transpeptidase FtsI family protein n=1 Tax=Actinomyces sp. zg-332 TaxID=2708340 RepID=UPI0014216CD2|nr:penicillin-binding protein 2 [Actinomyces sp. zg-332]QPK94421.1 penicillin-binding protein 2 [Actinomyces sp. zg-332]